MRRSFTLSILLLTLTACAFHAPYPLGIKGVAEPNVLVAPTSVSARVADISDIQSGGKTDAGDNDALIHKALNVARMHVDDALHSRLRKIHGVHVLNVSRPVNADKPDFTLARKKGAQLLLVIEVAGYGKVERRWVLLMAGSGLVEGIGQGVATASITGNPLIGAGVGLEEIASESLTWLGGAWLWNKYLAPVTLEGRLWRVRDGKLVWYKIEFSDSSNLLKLLFGGKKLPKEEALAMSLKQAENDLFEDFRRYMDKQILFARKERK